MLKISIDLDKIEEHRIVAGQKGRYVDLVIMERRQPDNYGNTHFVAHSITKQERESGAQGKIIGNGKELGVGGQRQAQQRPSPQQSRQQYSNRPQYGAPPEE